MQTFSARFFALFRSFLYLLNLLQKTAGKILPLKFLQTKFKYFAFFFSLVFYLVNPTAVAADYLKVNAPAEIFVETPFEVSLDISAQANSDYFVKARIGKEISKLKNGQTFSESKGVWLSDTVSWTSFPSFTTDSSGHYSGKIKVQASKNSELGQNLLVIRTRDGNGKLTDSPAYSVNILSTEQAPVPAKPEPVVVKTAEPILNEFMPQPPTSSKEWVEIKNKGEGSIDLSGWKIDDEPGKSSPQIIDQGTLLAPGGFLVVTLQSSKLNDLADSVRLLKPDDTVVESYTYNETVRGQSWAKDSGGNWILTSITTPGTENPNFQTASPVATPKPQVPVAKTSPETTSQIVNKLPQVLGTSSAKLASVSASFIKKDNSAFAFGLISLGGLFILGSGIFLIKRKQKSGQSELSD